MYHVFLTTGAWTTLRYHSLFSCLCIQLTSGHHTSHVTQCAGPRHTKIEGHAMASRREAKRFALRTEGEGLRDTPQSDVSRCPTSPSMRRRRSAAHLNRTSDRRQVEDRKRVKPAVPLLREVIDAVLEVLQRPLAVGDRYVLCLHLRLSVRQLLPLLLKGLLEVHHIMVRILRDRRPLRLQLLRLLHILKRNGAEMDQISKAILELLLALRLLLLRLLVLDDLHRGRLRKRYRHIHFVSMLRAAPYGRAHRLRNRHRACATRVHRLADHGRRR